MFKTNRSARRSGANVALAIALMAGSALGTVALEAPAYAQKKKTKEAKPDYSAAFIEAARPVEAALGAATPDAATAATLLPALRSSVSTADDKYAAGGMVYNIGRLTDDSAMQREGVAMMLESGRTPAENVSKFNMLAGQLAYNAQDWAAAQTYLLRAEEAGADIGDTTGLLTETYFAQNQNQQGLTLLRERIAARQAAGLEIDQNWVRRGLSVAYEGNMPDEAVRYSVLYVTLFPSPDAWGDAIAIQRNMLDYQPQETLDLLRLARAAKVLRNERDYLDYVDAADFRRLPSEVVAVLDEGIADGSLQANNPYVTEVRGNANGRIAADKAELSKLEADARAAGAGSTIVIATGDAFLNYDQPAKAEEFYTMALDKPGADTPRVLTRLGIAQMRQGKAAEAQATFAKVDGARQAIARLWGAYAAGSASAPATTVQPGG